MMANREQPLSGQVALITNTGRGLGRVIALAFAEAGATVAATDQTPDSLVETVRQIRMRSSAVKGYPADNTRPEQVVDLAAEVLQDWGRIDILVNVPSLPARLPLQELSEWEWQLSLNKNLTAPFYMLRAVSTVMALQANGAILNITASEALGQAEEGLGAFSACNAGLVSLTRTAARELDGDNIRVHAICGGDLALFSDHEKEIFQTEEIQEMMTGVAKLAVYLCSPNASHLTGQVLLINRSPEA